MQIKHESFLEDINNLLNAGEVPNLYPSNEKQEICAKMRQLDRFAAVCFRCVIKQKNTLFSSVLIRHRRRHKIRAVFTVLLSRRTFPTVNLVYLIISYMYNS